MRGFPCFERFCRIQVYKPKSQEMFLRLRGSKKIAKETQNDPTQAKPAYQNKHQNATEQGGETAAASGHHGLTMVTTTGHGGCHG